MCEQINVGERYCDNCKHADKKITEEPCFICNAWCNKWEAKDEKSNV